MNFYLLSADVSPTTLYADLKSIFDMVITTISTVITTITGNPLFYVPVLLALGAGVTTIAIKIVRRLGLNGIGRRRRRRRG